MLKKRFKPSLFGGYARRWRFCVCLRFLERRPPFMALASCSGTGTGAVVTDLLFLEALFFLEFDALEVGALVGAAALEPGVAEDDLLPILWRSAKRFAGTLRRR